MKVSKAILAVATGVALSTAALGQDQAAVSAEKTTGIKTLVPGAYANLQLRHVTAREMTGDEVTNDIPKLEVRPTLGATFFNDKLDSSFLWIFSKKADTTAVSKDVLVNATQLKALEGKVGYVGPYAETYMSEGGNFSQSLVGLYGEAGHDIPLAIGSLSLSGWGQYVGGVTSKEFSGDNKVKPENRTGDDNFALNAEGDQEIEQRDPSIGAYQAVGVKLKPAALPGFSVGTEIEYDRDFTPKYDAILVDDDTRTEQDGYTVDASTTTKLNLGYKLTDSVSLSNSLRHTTVGFYEAGKDGKRWENRLSLTAVLF